MAGNYRSLAVLCSTKIFKKKPLAEIDRPKQAKIDCPIGFP